MNCPATPAGGGSGMKFRKPFNPITRKITPARYRAITAAILITRFLPFGSALLLCANNIDANTIDDVYFREIQVS
jgi:hypothetical protein